MDDKKRSRKKRLYQDIIQQVEFYFSVSNLSKDRFMTHSLAENENGIELAVLLTFNRIKSLTTDVDVLVKALKLSKILELTENETRVKSNVRFTPKQDVDESTIYVERLPLDANIDFMKQAFSSFGKIDYVSLPKFPNKKIKGFGFVEFSDPAGAQRAVEEFKRNGTYLPIDMVPGNLRSICTLDKKMKEKMLKLKSRNFDFNECQNSSKDDEDMAVVTEEIENVDIEAVKIESSYDSEDNEKKRKNKTSPSTLERKKKKVKSEDDEILKTVDFDKSIENPTDTSTENPCDKSVENSSDKSIENQDISMENIVNPVKGEQLRNLVSEEETEMSELNEDNHDDNQNLKAKKKRRQKKKPRKDRPTATNDLLILSKSDWKKLRNKYLNVQWEKMKSLKKHLYKCKEHMDIQNNGNCEQMGEANYVESSVEVPKSVVKVCLNEPVVDIKQFKTELKSKSDNIANIDVKEGSSEVHVRFSTSVAAQKFTSACSSWKCNLISGTEEIAYWSKIHQDRKNKFDKRYKKAEYIAEEVPDNSSTNETKDIPKGLKEKPTLTIVPGTVVRLQIFEPIIDYKQFKKDISSSCKNVLYIDVKEGDWVAFVRLDTAESAQAFSKSNSFGQGTILSGEEEQTYWDKINNDRINKFNKSVRINKRGKQKIIKKAEKLMGKHILLEDPDDM